MPATIPQDGDLHYLHFFWGTHLYPGPANCWLVGLLTGFINRREATNCPIYIIYIYSECALYMSKECS